MNLQCACAHVTRIAYITMGFPNFAGESFLTPEIDEASRIGRQIYIFPRSPGPIRHHYTRAVMLDTTPLFQTNIWVQFIRFAARNSATVHRIFNILKCSSGATTYLKNLLVVPKAVSVARQVQKHKIQHIHAHWGLTTSSIALIANSITGVPWSMTLHRGDIVGNNMLAEKLYHASFARFISADGIKLAKEVGIRQFPVTTRVIHMGIEIPSTFSQHRKTSCIHRFICPGNLLKIKGHQFLLEAIEFLKEEGVKFVVEICGDGPLRRELISSVERMGIESHVKFVGHIARSQLLRTYAQEGVCCVILPSIDLGFGQREGIPVALMEAMAHQVPVISTRTGGIPELVAADCGILVPPANGKALAEAMQSVMFDNELRLRLTKNGLQRVVSRFNVSRTTQELLTMIDGASSISDTNRIKFT